MLLTARRLSMSYPGVRALDGVDFDLRAGEIHALCGENGAGKSTLIKILGGVIPHGSHGGELTLEGTPCRFSGPADALKVGIRVIHQELALCNDLSVAANFFLGGEPLKYALLDGARMESETRAALAQLGLDDIDPRAPVGSLPVGLQQMVEIARALRTPGCERRGTASASGAPVHSIPFGGRVLILDEPTSALSARETARLEEVLRALRAKGYGLLYISHRLDEVKRLADRVTVLRNGRSEGTLEGSGIEMTRVVSMMVGGRMDNGKWEMEKGTGNALSTSHFPLSISRSSPSLLSLRDWTVPSDTNPRKNAVEAVSFDLRAGEIVGLAGLMGAGRTELAESLCGLYPVRGHGELRIEGRPYTPRDARHALRHGIALLGEDRRGKGIFPDKCVRVNMTCSALRAFCPDASLGMIPDQGREREAVAAQIDALRVKTPGTDFPMAHLSGGNQQKSLFGRALLARPRILILDEPTRGVDVGAKEEIYALIRHLAGEGMGILLISSETEEVLRLAGRVIVLRGGRTVAERPASELSLESTLALAAGGLPESPDEAFSAKDAPA